MPQKPMTPPRNQVALKLLDPAFMLGVVLTVAFYSVIHQPAFAESILHRYTASNVVEHVIVWLLIWGVTDALLKILWFPKELLAIRAEWLPARDGREPAENAVALLEQVSQKPRWMLSSRLGRRLVAALEFVAERKSSEGYQEHLKYLADQDEDTTHSNYTLIRFVAGVAPVLGFLGTVIHFGTALSGISFDEISERLPLIVSEMGSAFNTTAVALATAMLMMFSLFACERIERGFMRSIDRLIDRELLNRFDVKDPNIVPFLAAVQSANEEALATIGSTLDRQVEVWVQSLESLFQRFDERQNVESQNWQNALAALQQRHDALDAGREERLQQILTMVESRQEKHLGRIQTMLDRTVAFKDEFAALTRALEGLARGEGQLVELQSSLAENLRLLRETQQIDEALHGLTAAIHLMTARHRPGGLPDSRAA